MIKKRMAIAVKTNNLHKSKTDPSAFVANVNESEHLSEVAHSRAAGIRGNLYSLFFLLEDVKVESIQSSLTHIKAQLEVPLNDMLENITTLESLDKALVGFLDRTVRLNLTQLKHDLASLDLENKDHIVELIDAIMVGADEICIDPTHMGHLRRTGSTGSALNSSVTRTYSMPSSQPTSARVSEVVPVSKNELLQRDWGYVDDSSTVRLFANRVMPNVRASFLEAQRVGPSTNGVFIFDSVPAVLNHLLLDKPLGVLVTDYHMGQSITIMDGQNQPVLLEGGAQVAFETRKRHPETIVILLTGNWEDKLADIQVDGTKLFDRVLKKPLNKGLLQDALNAVLQERFPI